MRSTLRSAKRQRGSALVLVLMVALLLSVLGLGLVFATELEMQLGGTEKVVTNNFYAAESGIHSAMAAVMVTQDWRGESFAILEGPLGADRWHGHRVITSRIQAVGAPQAPPLSTANEGEEQFHSFSVVMNSVAQRVSWPEEDTTPIYDEGDSRETSVTIQAQSSQAARYFLSPLRTPATVEDLYDADDPVSIY